MKFHFRTVYLVVLSFVLGSPLFADPTYVSGKASEQEAANYSPAKVASGRYLSYRDLDPYLKKTSGNVALDYGSGLGFSSEYLQTKGFKTESLDINEDMVKLAKKNYPSLSFKHISIDEPLPFKNRTFDLVFSSLVLFEMGTVEGLIRYLKESTRVLNDHGLFIGATGSAELYNPKRNWGTFNSDYPQNYDLKSGKLVRIHAKGINLTFDDYYWTEEDYRGVFKKAGLEICAILSPLGKAGEGYDWRDELKFAPFWVFIAAKTCPLKLPASE